MGIQINGQTDTVTATDGSINVGGDVTIPGILTYEDVTNVDSVGVITARDGLNVTGGRVLIGTTTEGESGADDLTIATSSTTGITIRSGTSNAGNIYFSDGTSGAAEYRGYISYMHNEDSFAIGADGNEKVRITSDGAVGIGTITPGAKLEVFDATSNTILNVKSGDAGAVLNLIDDSARSSIEQNGTTLKISSDTGAEDPNSDIRLQVDGASKMTIRSDGGVLVGGHASPVDSGNQPNIEIVNTSTSTLTLARNDTSISNGNDIAAIRVWGNDSNGTYQQCAEILAEADGDHGTGDKPTALAFKVTADGASSPTERFRIDSSGRVGINVTNPDLTLHVNGVNALPSTSGSTPTGHLTLRAKAQSSTHGMFMGVSNASPWSSWIQAQDNNNNATNYPLLLNPNGGNIGINCNSPGSILELNAAADAKMGISLGAVGDNITASRYIGICKTADQTDLGANSGFQGIEFGGPSSTNEGYIAFHTHDLGVESGERIRLTKDGKFGVGLTDPESKVHIRSTTSYGKDTYATANTGGSQTPPPGTFKWDNSTPVASSNGRGYRAWVQSGDAYPNASNYIDVLIRNGGFYRITLKRSHSSAEASVCQMMIYGLANNANTNYPVVHMTGASGSGTSTATVQNGNGRGSSNAVGSFYWDIHSYNVNSYDTIIRISTTGSNNQGIVALIERI